MKQQLILIIDDEAKISRMLGRRLKKAGYQFLVANNGADGIQQAMSLQPDLILLDIHMPDLDGFEVIRSLRAKGYTGTVSACSASVAVRDSNLTIEAGCDYFISKPIDLTFETTIANFLMSNK